MIFLLTALLFIAGHFGAYVLWLRHGRPLRKESGIFIYHAAAYLALLGLLTAARSVLGWPDARAGIVFAASLHGIYSLSFLELWSLTQGSYSLGILAHVAQIGGRATPDDLLRLQTVGVEKKSARSLDLGRLGLLRADGMPTLPGRAIAFPLRAILWLANARTMN